MENGKYRDKNCRGRCFVLFVSLTEQMRACATGYWDLTDGLDTTASVIGNTHFR